MAAQAQLTEWQRSHLEHVSILLKQAEETIRSLKTEEKKAERGEEISPETTWLKFRYIVFDLYSFPYWAKDGVAISDSRAEKDQTKKFVTLS